MSIRSSKARALTEGSAVPVRSFTADELVVDPYAKDLYDQAKLWAAGNEGVTAGSVINFAITVMRSIQLMVSQAKAFKGEYKKRMVMTILRMVIKNDVKFDSVEDRAYVLAIVEDTIPTFIDTMILIAKGDVDLGKLFGAGCCGSGTKGKSNGPFVSAPSSTTVAR